MNKYQEALDWVKNELTRNRYSTEQYFRKAHKSIDTLQERIDNYANLQSYPNFESETDVNKLKSFIRFLLKGNEQLDKALDKACDYISRIMPYEINELVGVDYLYTKDKGKMKEYLLNESEKQ